VRSGDVQLRDFVDRTGDITGRSRPARWDLLSGVDPSSILITLLGAPKNYITPSKL